MNAKSSLSTFPKNLVSVIGLSLKTRQRLCLERIKAWRDFKSRSSENQLSRSMILPLKYKASECSVT